MFFWNSLGFSMIQRMLATWSLVPLPFLKPAWTSGSSWLTYCWSLAWRILKTLESPLDCKEIQLVHSKGDQSWVFIGRTDAEAENSNTLATWCEELTHWKRLWCWEGLGAGGEGDDRGQDGWMASPTWWTWVQVNSRSWWWTGRPGVLRFMGSRSRTRLSDGTELNDHQMLSHLSALSLYYWLTPIWQLNFNLTGILIHTTLSFWIAYQTLSSSYLLISFLF